jgi:hypothetical protein
MALLEARLTGALQAAQVPRGSAAEVVEEDKTVERVVPDALGSGADAPWPGMADEASFLADQRGQGIVPPAVPANEPTDLSPLPSLEELVQRIPAEARAALDDLFRAKFTGVRRVSKKSLKT